MGPFLKIKSRGEIKFPDYLSDEMDSVAARNRRNRPHPIYQSNVTIQVWDSPQAFRTGDTKNIYTCAWHETWLPIAGSHLVLVDVEAPLDHNGSRTARVETINARVNVNNNGTWVDTTIVCVCAGSLPHKDY